jgi:hypothetical protein
MAAAAAVSGYEIFILYRFRLSQLAGRPAGTQSERADSPVSSLSIRLSRIVCFVNIKSATGRSASASLARAISPPPPRSSSAFWSFRDTRAVSFHARRSRNFILSGEQM